MSSFSSLLQRGAGIGALLTCSVAGDALAQPATSPKVSGGDTWPDRRASAALDLRTGLAIADNRNAPGENPDSYAAIAWGIDAALDWARGRDELGFTLHLLEGLSYSPAADDVAKAMDDADLALTYRHGVTRWLGFGARAELRTSLFGSRIERDPGTHFVLTRGRDSSTSFTAAEWDLTHALSPIRIVQGAGAWFHLGKARYVLQDSFVGLSGIHVFSNGSLTVQDKDFTPAIEVSPLRSYQALAPTLHLDVTGELQGRFEYAGSLELRLPLISTESDRRNVADNLELEAKIGLRLELLPYLTLDYDLEVSQTPLEYKGVSVQNRLMLSAHPMPRTYARKQLRP